MGMTRRRFIRNAGLALGAGLAATVAGSAGKARGVANPNVLVMMVDDQSIRTLWAQSGIRNFFDVGGANLTAGAYGECALCAPARTSFLTGQYVHVHGTGDNDLAYIRYRRQNFAANDLYAKLHRNGYRVGHFGKFLNNYQDSAEFPNGGKWVHPACDRWIAPINGQSDASAYDYNHDGTISTSTEDHTVLFGDAAETFIRNGKSIAGPWACFFQPTDPHTPYTPVPVDEHAYDGAKLTTPGTQESDFSDKSGYWRNLSKDGDAYQQTHYEGELEEGKQNDRYFLKMIDALRDTGQLDNTLIFYVSDNGYMLGEHGGLSEKQKPYEESSRVPLLMRGPGLPGDGAIDAAWGTATPLISRIDIPFTILSAAGITTSTGDGINFQGRDLRNLTNGPSGWRKRVFFEQPDNVTSNGGWAAVREGAAKLIRIYRTDENELYHLNDDPYENENLAKDAAYAPEVADLQSKVAAYRNARTFAEIRGAES